MTWTAFILIFMSAALHASWNLLAKKYHMTIAFYAVICSTSAVLWLHTQFWTPVPVWELPLNFWLPLAGSVFCDCVLYCCGLVMVYRFMDMSSAYPMMRSLPLLLTAAMTALAGMGQVLSVFAVIGMVMIFCGCLLMPLQRFRDFDWRGYLNKNMLFILLCAFGTTGYTICDSLSLENMAKALAASDISKPVMSLTYYSTRGMFLGSSLLLTAYFLPGQKRYFKEMWLECKWAPFAAGFFASLTYALVLIAMNYVDNVSYVQAFRQLGLLIGLAAGIFILKERGTMPKYTGVFLIVSGLILTVIK